MTRAYFDWNATAPLRAEARAAMLAAADHSGNASSVHAEGRAARHIVETARKQVADLVAAEPANVVFTSGGTEANALALTPGLGAAGRSERCARLLVSAIEHPSVLSGGRFETGQVEHIPATRDGEVDLDALSGLLRGRPPALISVMLANNETGIVQPISEVAALVHEAGGLLHVDAVQAAGRIDIDINRLGADLLTISAHKIGGPQGSGALVCRDGLGMPAMIRGGGQERGFRAGTENVAGIAGFGAAAAAARAALASDRLHLSRLQQQISAGLRAVAPQTVIFGEAAERLANTILVALPGMKAETAVIAFDLAGVAVSSGSACSSGKVAPSTVLAAMGVEPALAAAAIRISFGWKTTQTEVELLLNAWNRLVSALPKQRTGLAA